ncbi:MAG: type II secretion system protein, partial [Phycisphaerae bacterium]|nr:type II secretion system protein [Phycisphaerae bacterium]
MKRRGFTLIELLMVVSIIILLMTLLVPGIIAAIRMANRAKCLGNLTTLGKALRSYEADHGVWPGRASAPNPYTWDDDLYDQLFSKYVPNPRLLYCPDNSHDMRPVSETWSKSWAGGDREISYAMLDGLPGPPDPLDAGTLDGTNSWNLSDLVTPTGAVQQGFRCVQNVYTWNGSSYVPSVQYNIGRPTWSDRMAKSNGPMLGDLVVERLGEAW